MDKKGSIQGTVLLYVVLMIVVAMIILIVLQFFTPYKFSNYVDSFIKAVLGIGGAKNA